jgi:outer membrane protein OmpU
MNNMKKIGLTALGTSLIATSAFAGSLDVTGSASITFSGIDKGTAANGWTMSDTVNFSGGGEMDNGWNVTVNYELDDNAGSSTTAANMDSRSLVIDTNGMGTVTFAGHGGSGAMGAVDDVVPTAYGESFDIVGTNSSSSTTAYNAIGSASSDNMFTYSSGDLVDGFSFKASYTPSGTGEVESSTDMAIEYTGMEGLTVGYASGEDNAAGGTSNTDNSTMYVKYAYGPVTVGYQESEIDANSATDDDDYEAIGITYQVSDDLTIGYTESTYNAGSETTDQENSNLSASYTMGGMTLSVAFAEEKNQGGSTAVADDVKGYNINLAFAF